MHELSEQLKTFDQNFNYRRQNADATDWFDTRVGKLPVIVSAPHACMHLRNGEYKQPEEYTGAIAQYLANICDCHAIYTSYQTDEDPNWQTNSRYKKAIADIVDNYPIRLLIDLHGMTNRYYMGVAIGTMQGKACHADKVVKHFTDTGFERIAANSLPSQKEGSPSRTTQMNMHGDDKHWRNLVVDHPRFTGGLVNQTVTRFASEQLGLEAVQIELASIVRVVCSPANDEWPYEYRGDEAAIKCTLEALQGLVRDAGAWPD